MTDTEPPEGVENAGWFGYVRATGELMDYPLVGGCLAVVLFPFALFGDFVRALVRIGARINRPR